MNLNPRLSHLVATVLCALALIFSTAHASAQNDAPVIGTLHFKAGCTVLVNGKKQPNGYQVHAGDVIKTSGNCKAEVDLADGGKLDIHKGTRVRVYIESSSVVAAVLIGGVDYVPSTRPGPNDLPVVVENGSDVERLPFLAAFGFGNFSFPSIGGGSSANNRLPITNASGQVIGYAVTDGSGRVVAFTDLAGNVLASGAPNGTPVSSVFGPGATI